MTNKINKEKKKEILNKVKVEGLMVKEVAERYGLSTKTIYRWIKEESEEGVSFWEVKKLRQENKVLKELIGAITLEMEKSKKRGS
ncbi:MAG: transposase [bacterium]|nr:transposase [bacterium]